MLIGQTNLISKINSYTITTLPKVMLFIGDTGCGKHSVAQYIANKLNLDYIDLEQQEQKAKDLQLYIVNPIPALYVVNLDLITDIQQNQLLKLIEEPYKNMYIVLISSSEVSLIDTLKTRCLKYYFEEYTEEQLASICSIQDELIYKILKTPGQIQAVDKFKFHELYKLCATFIEKFSTQDLSHVLVYANKLNYKDDYNKYDPVIFLKVMQYIAYRKYLAEDNKVYLDIYLKTTEFISKLLYKNINKASLIFSYLLALKQGV